MSFEEASALFITAPTAYAGLVLRAQLQPGEVCLIFGGAGGVGTAALQIAKALGATVIAVASTEEKLEVARRAGADHTVNYTNDSWIDDVKALGGADVVFDPVGLPTESTKFMNWNGRVRAHTRPRSGARFSPPCTRRSLHVSTWWWGSRVRPPSPRSPSTGCC